MNSTIVLAVLAPLAAALFSVVAPSGGRYWNDLAAVLSALAALVLLFAVGDGVHRELLGGWPQGVGIALQADRLSAVLVLMSALVFGAAGRYAHGYFQDAALRGHFWPLWLLLATAVHALLLSADAFNLYVTLELMGLAAVALAALGGTHAALRAALQYLLVGLAASMMYLAGMALLYAGYDSLDFGQLALRMESEPTAWMGAALMTAGILLKTALFPLHFWLPAAHANAPAPISAVLSALVVKVGFYAILRLWLDVFDALPLLPGAYVLGALGAAAVLWGSWQALRAPRLKVVAAYSTVAQLGYLFMFLPFLLGIDDAVVHAVMLEAVVLLALTHGFAKAGLFLAIGSIQKELGHDRVDGLHGIAQRLPWTTFALALAGVALIGLPPSGTFLAKWQLIHGALEAQQWWWALAVSAGSLLAAGYLFRVFGQMFSESDTTGGAITAASGESRWPLALALLATLGLGLGAHAFWALLDHGAAL